MLFSLIDARDTRASAKSYDEVESAQSIKQSFSAASQPRSRGSQRT